MSSARVVELNDSYAKPTFSPPAVIDAVRTSALKRLQSLLVDLFNNTDDALFERADRSHSNADQQMYFEAMRQLRLKRDQLMSDFAASVTQGFTRLTSGKGGDAEDSDDPDFDNVDLVQSEELEVTVAIAGIVSKVTSQHSLQIMQLTKRLDHVYKSRTISERNNPLGPQQLGESFAEALDCVDLQITVRIVLLKLFERFVMEQLADFYQEANRVLADAGVLPNLKNVREKAKSSAKPKRAPGGEATGGPEGEGGESGESYGYVGGTGSGRSYGAEFGVIQRLLAQADGRPGISAPATGEPTISTDQLLGVLSQLQSDANEVPALVDQTPHTMDLTAVLARQALDLTGSSNATLHQADDDVVTFVGMLFDYILNDRNLAIPMKALIARLQIPIVKLAIIDKRFFDQSNHPARRLLNELSSAGIGWSSANELKRDALYDKIESIVARVLNEFQSNPDVFSELVTELLEFVHSDRRRSDIVEQRLKETEHGKEKTQDAKRRAQNVINQKACGLRLHPMMGRFISDVWSKVLVYTGVKHGSDGTEWSETVQLLDQLLWSIQPLNSLDDVAARNELRPKLLAKLSEGMQQINFPADELTQRLAQIEQHLIEISEHDTAYLADEQSERPQIQEEEREVIKEVTLAVPVEDDEPEAVPEPRFIEQADKLAEGNWVELKSDSGGSQRCKLATIIGNGLRYVFVNRRGMKVAERSRMQLAQEIGSGDVTLLDESEVFDKALQAVIGNLRQVRGQYQRP